MAEYIEREAVLKKMQNWNAKERLINCVEDAPAAEVAPVIHARWVWKEEERPRLEDNPKFIDTVKHSFKYPYAPEEMWHCSHCGKPAVEHLAPHLTSITGRTVLEMLREAYTPVLCPNCGAKMDLE